MVKVSNIPEAIYTNSPVWLQTMILNAYAAKLNQIRGGKPLVELIEILKTHETFTETELAEYQNEKLRKLIHHAYNTVPYYYRIMAERKLKPKDIQTADDLKKLPLLTREDVRNNAHKLRSTAFKQSQLIKGPTSGTTGSPLEFYWDKKLCLFNEGVDWRQKRWAGLDYRGKIAVALGRVIVPIQQKKKPFWRMNYLHNQLWLSSFHMNENNLKEYFKKLESFQPAVIEGYPSTMFILAKYLEAKRITFPVKAILTSSETLLPLQREAIENAFQCKVHDFYGLAERVIFATECNRHEGLHLNSDYGITEVISSRCEPVARGALGYLVGTSLHNYGMPFIRYKTTDISSIEDKKCSCGCVFPLMSNVTTKAEDIVVLKDGRLISSSILTHPFKPLHHIQKSQIIQNDYDKITVKIVKRDGYQNKDTETLIKSLQERLGEDIDISIQFENSIPPDKSGKFRWVISKIPAEL